MSIEEYIEVVSGTKYVIEQQSSLITVMTFRCNGKRRCSCTSLLKKYTMTRRSSMCTPRYGSHIHSDEIVSMLPHHRTTRTIRSGVATHQERIL